MDDLELMLKSIIIKDLEAETGEEAEVGKFIIYGALRLQMRINPRTLIFTNIISIQGRILWYRLFKWGLSKVFNDNNASKLVLDGIALFDKSITV